VKRAAAVRVGRRIVILATSLACATKHFEIQRSKRAVVVIEVDEGSATKQSASGLR
jgi:hypothetical protein